MAVQLGNAYGQIIIDGAGAVSGIGAVQRSLGGLQGGFLGVNPLVVAFGAGLAGAGVVAGGFAAAIGTGVDKAQDLQSQLSAVQSLTGATTEEMDALRGAIDDLAVNPDLKVSAFEAADALEKLASNGVEVTDIVNGAAEATVLLANAMGTDDFAGAATTATDVMSLFGFRADQMREAVNGITSVVNESKFEFGDYQLALAQAGGVAAATGVEFEDFNTTIAGISNLFASGSDAGTSFKTFLQRLVPASSAADEAMAELGIITEDGQNQFFNANGQLRDMTEIAGILQNALGGLSEEQRNNALSTIFGTDAMRAAVGLANLGVEGFTNLQNVMAKTDAADAAATRMDNLKGKIEILQGIIESVQIRIGDAFIPVLTRLADAAATLVSTNADAIVGFFEGIATKAQAGAAGLEQLMSVIGAFGANLSEGMSPLDAFIEAIWDIAPQSVLDALVWLRDDILPGLTGAIGSLSAYLPSAQTAIMSFGGALAGAGIAATILGIVAAIVSLTNPITALIAAAALLGAAWAGNWGGIRDIVVNALTTMQPYLLQLETLFTKFNDLLLPRLQLAWNQLAISWTTQIAPALAQLWAALNNLMIELGLTSSETSAWDVIMGLLKITMLAVLFGVQSLTGAIAIWADMVSGAIEGATKFVNILISIKGALDSLVGGFADVIGQARDFAAQMANLSIPDWLTPGSPPPLAYALWDIGDAVSGIPNLGQSLAVTAAPAASLAGLAASPTPVGGGGGGTSNTVQGDIVIQVDGSRNPEETARAIRRELEALFNRSATGAFSNG